MKNIIIAITILTGTIIFAEPLAAQTQESAILIAMEDGDDIDKRFEELDKKLKEIDEKAKELDEKLKEIDKKD